MDILVKITVPNDIYRFYQKAAIHVANHSPEDIMADALSAYAAIISEDVAAKREQCMLESER